MRVVLSILLAGVLWPSELTAEQKVIKQDWSHKLNEDFDSKVNSILNRYHVPGLALAVIDNNRTFAKGYGFQRLPSSPVTPETLFFTGSTSKAFTAGAVSKLVDDTSRRYNHIQWDSRLIDLIRDDFVLEDSYVTNHVTLEDALSHRTGLPRHDFTWIGIEGLKAKDLVRKLRYLPLTAEIRTKFQYCNLMYGAVGHAIETLTGTWLGDFLRTEIWDPLQMNDTYFSLGDALRDSAPTLATGYEWSNDSQSVVETEWPYVDAVPGAGAVISNVLDYSRWVRSLFDRDGPFTDAAYTKFITAHSIPDPVLWKGPQQLNITLTYGGELYGLGWELSNYRDELLVSHGGGIMGFGTTLMYLPKRKWGFVAMGNVMGEGNTAGLRIGTELLDDLLETPDEERLDWDTIDRMRDEILQEQRDKSCSNIYPSLPSPPLSPALPIHRLTGTYWHPAYPVLHLYSCSSETPTPLCPKSSTTTPLICGTFSDIKRREFNMTFSHASGEFWFVEAQLGNAESLARIMPATFEIGADGAVSRLGIGLEPNMGPEGRIWYQKLGY